MTAAALEKKEREERREMRERERVDQFDLVELMRFQRQLQLRRRRLELEPLPPPESHLLKIVTRQLPATKITETSTNESQKMLALNPIWQAEDWRGSTNVSVNNYEDQVWEAHTDSEKRQVRYISFSFLKNKMALFIVFTLLIILLILLILFLVKYSQPPLANILPYSSSSNSSGSNSAHSTDNNNSLPGRSYGSQNEVDNLNSTLTLKYLNEGIRKAHEFKKQQQQRYQTNSAAAIQGIQQTQQGRTYYQTRANIPEFARYREKVMLFMREISRAFAGRTIIERRYEEFSQRYKAALLQSYEDELHITHCRVPCARCSSMTKNYVAAIYLKML